jgi:hypothetical protein
MEMEGWRPRHVRDIRNHVDRLDVLFFVIIEEKRDTPAGYRGRRRRLDDKA